MRTLACLEQVISPPESSDDYFSLDFTSQKNVPPALFNPVSTDITQA